jgi:hypothetical protein
VLRRGWLYVPGSGPDAARANIVHGLRVFDLGDPSAPQEIGTADYGLLPNDVAFVDELAFVTGYAVGSRSSTSPTPCIPKRSARRPIRAQGCAHPSG